MPVGTHFTTPGVVAIGGLMAQMETSVRLGTEEDSLNTAVSAGGDDVYIGIDNAKVVNLGEVIGIGFTHAPSRESAGSSNVLTSAFRAVTELEVTASFTLQQLSPQVIHKLVSTGELITVNTIERIVTGGVACETTVVPLEFSAVNQACGAPASAVDVEIGLQAMIITGYRAESQSGFTFDDLARAGYAGIDTEWAMLPKTGMLASRHTWSAYFF